MEGASGLTFDGANAVRKKRRSFSSRRPRSDSQFFHEGLELPSLSPTLGSDPKAASDDNSEDDPCCKQKELKSINGLESECATWTSSSEDSKRSRQNSETIEDSDDIPMKVSDKYYSSGAAARSSYEFKRSSEGVLAPANWKSSSSQRQNQVQSTETGVKRVKAGSGELVRGGSSIVRNLGSKSHPGQSGSSSNGMRSENGVAAESEKGQSSQESKLRKVKLKVGGVTHTIHTKATPNSGGNRRSSLVGSFFRPPRSSDVSSQRRKLILQDDLNDESQSPSDSANGLQGIPWNHFKEPIRKSKRVPKRRVLDGDFDGDDDDEIQYLERLKTSKANLDYGAEYDETYQEEENHKKRSSRGLRKRAVQEFDEDANYDGRTSSQKENHKKARSTDADDLYYVDEEESSIANEDDETIGFNSGSRRKKPKTGLAHGLADDKDIPLTSRQRALQSGKDASSGVSLVEFPDGLPAAAPRKQKEKLSEVEQLLKKAEAAQRRRMQVEKAARESEAQAIRKILGQDTNGKKREDKLRKRKEEMAQEKASRAMTLASNTVRWITGPSGTVVSFPKDADLPSIFNPPLCSYPPPREKCSGPSCTNTYKYRDSKSKLPLCSLQCYKAVNNMLQPVTSC